VNLGNKKNERRENRNVTLQNLINQGIAVGLKVVGAIALWIAGVWLIGFAMHLLMKPMERQKVDTTHVRYILIRESFGEAGFAVPEQHFVVRKPA
jgi:hypothetical protein